MVTLVNTLIFYSFQQLSCQQDVPNITHQEKFSIESSSSTIFYYITIVGDSFSLKASSKSLV